MGVLGGRVQGGQALLMGVDGTGLGWRNLDRVGSVEAVGAC